MDSVYLWALLIFAARVVDVTLGTIRVQLIVRRRKSLAAIIGFVEVLIFILVVSRVIQGGVRNWPYVIAYAGGFAIGTLVGISLSQRLTRGVVEVTIIPHGPWEPVEEAVRQAGHALTHHTGQGREGPVEIFHVVCGSRQLPQLMRVVQEVDPKAFLYCQELAASRGGYIYGMKSKL